MYYLDLFSGIGGFALGAYWAGWRFDEHYFSEVEKFTVELYQKRFPDAYSLGDIRVIYGRNLPRGEWIITGGFPCQDISIAGKGEGISGARSGLWFEMWRIIRDLQPRWVIIENVGAITFRGLSTVLNSLAEIGYDAEWQDIRASDMGAPHRRERIWIVAYPNKNRESIMSFNDKQRQRELGQNVAYTDNSGRTCRWHNTRVGMFKKNKREIEDGNRGRTTQWATEPAVGRVADGVPHRVERLQALGNSIVPQIAGLLFRRIKEIEDGL